ncbi:hypothetical protein [Bdellovibrio sp. HCB337]|uniref:hypothetical protein n=1 Tax=Bdellovibrio sp. HCB337 TaxID=3394358 RepID=UPI0039A7069F
MKTLLVSFLVLGSSLAFAQDSGLKCTMSYSSTNVLSTSTDSTSSWLVAGGKMDGSAVGADKRGGWTSTPAHSIAVDKKGGVWTVTILNDKKASVGSFSFPAKDGMKATIPTEAYFANESEDPTKYNKLEVSCHFTIFAG